MDRQKLQDKIEIKTAALLSNSHNLKSLEQKGNAIMVFTDEIISLVVSALAETSNEQSNCNIHSVSVAVCEHPTDKRVNYHDEAVLCTECDCIISQFGKEINPPHKL